MAAPRDESRITFDPGPGKKLLSNFIEGIAIPPLCWAWRVTRDCLDVVGHHSTPSGEQRRIYTTSAWMDWYGAFLFDAAAQHTVHGLAQEVRDACPREYTNVLRQTVEDAFRACDLRTPQEKAVARAARAAASVARTPDRPTGGLVLPDPTPIPGAPIRHPFAVLTGGKE
jgi:hypothetical protein